MADVAVPVPLAIPNLPTPAGAKAEVGAAPATPSSASSSSTPDVAFLDTPLRAPFDAIGQLFDHLRANPAAAEALNATYPTRGVFKAAAVRNGTSDQKLTVDLSPNRLSGVPDALRATLAPHGFDRVLEFFGALMTQHLDPVMGALGASAAGEGSNSGIDFAPLHRARNVNFRLCDYTPDTAAPQSENGCGAHRDYGTFSIIFQDGTAGLEVESPARPGVWLPVPADRVVVLCGWSAFVLSGGELRAVRHRVRRQPGVRRLSAVLFVAPDLDVVLRPLPTAKQTTRFSNAVTSGEISVSWFKEFMGKRWRYREGNAQLEDGERITQDVDIERLLLA
ncbi:hypothetical protein SLS62_009153 [Diatrype stigma]|uniref:Fe2OG dioxygenase domain-containing protein n=1 Tax=Diatrype stigma TaxID=117547 RepID=A0AAN9UHQ2_9PEZI